MKKTMNELKGKAPALLVLLLLLLLIAVVGCIEDNKKDSSGDLLTEKAEKVATYLGPETIGILVIALIIIVLAAIFIGTVNLDNNWTIARVAKYAFGMWVLVVAIVLCTSLIVTIPAGFEGVEYSWLSGGVQDKYYGEGTSYKSPFSEIWKYPVRTQQKTKSMHALSNEGLSIQMDATLTYKISPGKACEIHRGIGPSYEEVVVLPQFRSVVREAVAEYQAADIYTEKRAVLEQKVVADITQRLKGKDIIVENVLFRNIELPPQLKTSIEEKKKAEQDALRMEYVLLKETQEAKRKIIEAGGIADANKIIASGLTDQYLKWYWMKEFSDNDNVMFVQLGADGTPMYTNTGTGNIGNVSGVATVFDIASLLDMEAKNFSQPAPA